jgi:hypothetical protein
MAELVRTEYEALRATIRQRGTLRMWAILVGVVAWAWLAMTLVLTNLHGAVTLIPILVLAVTFELSFFIHTGVERIGRYIQVFFEEASDSMGWETVAMSYGRSFPGGVDPLFITVFAVSGGVNFLSSLAIAPRSGWILISFLSHILFGWRLVTARRLAASQRVTDLERFRALKSPPVSN